MRLELQLYKDDGTLVHTSSIDALHPGDWKTMASEPIVEGGWLYFGWTYQPIVQKAGKAGGF
jgi:hypothetical protein